MIPTDGGPAFPTKRMEKMAIPNSEQAQYVEGTFPGMSLRDWFAGQVVAGALAYGGLADAIRSVNGDEQKGLEVFVTGCFFIADVMLKERAK